MGCEGVAAEDCHTGRNCNFWIGMPEVPGQNVWVVLFLAALLAAIAAFACWLPARRASAVNPIEALRAE